MSSHGRRAVALAVLLMATAPVVAQEPDLGTDAQRAAGEAIYLEKCAQCHGDTGAGDGVAAQYFRPAPRDFTAGVYKFRTTESGQLPTDADIRRSIRRGMPYTGMPAWPELSEAQVNNLVYHIKTFNDDFAGPFGTPTAIDIPSAPRPSAESIARGREVYVENQCSDCHGDRGRGDGPSAPTLEDQWEVHIKPADLTRRWTFRGGSTMEDIYRTFSTGLDGSPMPSYDIQPEADKWALVHYVHSLSRDAPNYSSLVVARPFEGAIPLDTSAFANASPAYFPVVGQVIEPGRAFFPGTNGIEVRAVYNADEVAFMLTWHNMTSETAGSNDPTMAVDDSLDYVPTDSIYSDAVAIQLPMEMPAGAEMPYMMFGDSRRSVDLWYVEMGGGEAQRFSGAGSANLMPLENVPEVTTSFADGAWTAIFKRSRVSDDALTFAEGTFIPIAFTVWDGFYGERGNKRGLTSWYHVYMEPLTQESPAGPMARSIIITLLLGFGFVAFIRYRSNAPATFMPDGLRKEVRKGRVDVALDVIRIALGIMLFIRGVIFAADTSSFVALIQGGELGAIGSGIFVHVVVVAHIIGGLMLATGFRTRVAALIQIPVLIGAVAIAFAQGGLFETNQSLELAVLVLVLLIVLFLFGSGHYSLDHYLFRRHKTDADPPIPTASIVGYTIALAGIATLIAILILGTRLLVETFSSAEIFAVGAVTVLVVFAFLLFYGFAFRNK